METPSYDTDAQADTNPSEVEPDADDAQAKAEEKEAEENAKLVAKALECYRLGMDTTSEWRESAIEDLEFLAGEQWDGAVKGQRDTQGRPALTVNRLPQFVRQVTNEQRQSKPAVTVNPVDSNSDVRTAEVLQGVIRNIEYTSNADAAYASGGESAARVGLGYWDIAAEYEDEKSFEQRLTIRRIRNPLAALMDPAAKEVAGDDARWALLSWDISKAEWKATYPDKEAPTGSAGWGGKGDAPEDWVAKDGVRIHEYRYVVEEKDTLHDVSQAEPALQAALKAAGIDVSSGGVLASEVGPTFAAKLTDEHKLPTRDTTKRTCRFAKIAGNEVIEKGELAGRYLQLVRVVGAELDINGKAIYEGVIRHAKDTQRALNYAVSAEMEAIALAPKAPWLMAEGQDEGYEAEWENANQRAQSRLRYKPVTLGGQPLPPPQRVMGEANIQAITVSRQQAGQDLSDVTGIYPTQFGAPAPESSGKAILARQSQGNVNNFHFSDNLAMAIRYTGRVLIDLIPKIYSGPRVLRILGEDGKHQMVAVNGAPQPENADGDLAGDGQEPIHLDAGRYDVAVSMGPSYQSRRQEAAAQLLELIKVNPAISQVAGDLLVQSMDIPGGNAIAERLQKLLPPQIRPPDEKLPPAQVLAQQVQGLSQQHDQLVQTVHALHDALESKDRDNASKERIALMQVQAGMLQTAAKLDSAEAQALLEHTVGLIAQRLELDGMSVPAMQPQQPQPTPQQPQQQPQPPMPGAQPGGMPNAQ